jgi:hypothetical protein
MKKFCSLVGVLATLILMLSSSHVFAFHDGGVAQCEGCHTMHNSSGGTAMTTNGTAIGTANAYLLQGQDASSTCLNCHQGDTADGSVEFLISTSDSALPAGSPPLQLTPGGDFGWLKKDYTWAGGESKGEHHGHNIVALDYGYSPDTTLSNAPGGSTNYPANKLGCMSCHDPHGRYRILSTGVQGTTGKPIRGSGSYGAEPDATTAVGVYRLLGGTGYYPESVGAAYAFLPAAILYQAPYAVSPTDYNRSEASSDTRVAYGKFTDTFCVNCHDLFHSTFASGLVHPVGQTLSSTERVNYNKYVKSGDMSGDVTTAYLSLVPFQEDNTTNLATLLGQTTKTTGASGAEKVTCLSCHRAHASGFDSMLRFSVQSTFITINGAYPDKDTDPANARGRTSAETQQAYYDRPPSVFATYQRVLCNKCHAKD